jgi:sodium/bile acid cotransporter 7
MSKFFNQLSRVGLNAFFFCMLGVILLAWMFPSVGSEKSVIPFSQITKYGVSVIFFFYGVKLSPAELFSGLKNWKLHTVIQATTFVVFPLIALLVIYFFGSTENILWLGFYYLAVLPSTVSSSVVMVSIAGGNVPAAIFNASISSIIGIFVTPLWMSVYSVAAENDIELKNVIIKLCVQVLLPLILGLALHKRLGNWAQRHKTVLRNADQLIILLIVYTAFCEAFLGNMFSAFGAFDIIKIGVGMLAFFLVMVFIMYAASAAFGFELRDRIAIIFCGSKKSLVQGAVMGRVLFPDPLMLGVVLLPLMLYHALQLMAGSAIANTIANTQSEKNT